MSSNRIWSPHSVNDWVGGAIIQEKLNDARLQSELEYLVLWPCCGRTGVQTHSQLSKRVREGRTLCWHCARKLRNSPSPCKPPKGDELAQPVIEIPLPGISGRWTFFTPKPR